MDIRMATAYDVAMWMNSQIQKDGVLYQDEAVDDIATKFGESFAYINDKSFVAFGFSPAKFCLSLAF